MSRSAAPRATTAVTVSPGHREGSGPEASGPEERGTDSEPAGSLNPEPHAATRTTTVATVIARNTVSRPAVARGVASETRGPRADARSVMPDRRPRSRPTAWTRPARCLPG